MPDAAGSGRFQPPHHRAQQSASAVLGHDWETGVRTGKMGEVKKKKNTIVVRAL